jgi:hypothetical protein
MIDIFTAFSISEWIELGWQSPIFEIIHQQAISYLLAVTRDLIVGAASGARESAQLSSRIDSNLVLDFVCVKLCALNDYNIISWI